MIELGAWGTAAIAVATLWVCVGVFVYFRFVARYGRPEFMPLWFAALAMLVTWPLAAYTLVTDKDNDAA